MKTKKSLTENRAKYLFLGMFAITSVFAGGGKAISPASSPIMPMVVTSPLPFYVGLGLVWTGVREECVCGDDIIDSTYGGILMWSLLESLTIFNLASYNNYKK